MRRSLIAVSAVVCCSALVLAGCSGSSSSSGTSTTAGRSGATSTTTPIPIKTNPQYRSRAVLSSCAAAHGGWQASGTVSNPGSAPYTYLLTVYFTNDAATVVGSGTASVSVQNGATGKWTVTTSLAGQSTVKCVLVGVA